MFIEIFENDLQNYRIKKQKQPPEVFLEIFQNSQENNCARVSFLIKLQVAKKENLAQVFSCEFYEISKSNFFTEHLWATASGRRSFT